MVSKALVAVVAVVAIAAVGVGVFYFMNNGSLTPLDVDEVKTDLRVGDFVEYQLDLSITEEFEDEVSSREFTNILYVGLPSLDKTTKTIDYKGQSIVCDYYVTKNGDNTITCAIDPKSGVTYELTSTTEKGTTSMLLKDTNLDLSLTKKEQKAVAGSYIIHEFAVPYMKTYSIKGDSESRLTKYDPLTDRGTEVSSSYLELHDTIKDMIIQITPAGKYITNLSTDVQTRDDYLSSVSFDSYVKSAEAKGKVISYTGKTTDVIDTALGKRHVTIQTIEIYDKDTKETSKAVFTYGDKGFIYKINRNGVVQGQLNDLTMTIKSTSLTA